MRPTDSAPSGANDMDAHNEQDLALMKRAIDLAGAVRGTTSPNPWVGCVVLPEGFGPTGNRELLRGSDGASGRSACRSDRIENSGRSREGLHSLYDTRAVSPSGQNATLHGRHRGFGRQAGRDRSSRP